MVFRPVLTHKGGEKWQAERKSGEEIGVKPAGTSDFEGARPNKGNDDEYSHANKT